MIEMLWLTTPSDRWHRGPRKALDKRPFPPEPKRRKVANSQARGV